MAFNGLIRAQLNANCGSEIRVSESAGREQGCHRVVTGTVIGFAD